MEEMHLPTPWECTARVVTMLLNGELMVCLANFHEVVLSDEGPMPVPFDTVRHRIKRMGPNAVLVVTPGHLPRALALLKEAGVMKANAARAAMVSLQNLHSALVSTGQRKDRVASIIRTYVSVVPTDPAHGTSQHSAPAQQQQQQQQQDTAGPMLVDANSSLFGNTSQQGQHLLQPPQAPMPPAGTQPGMMQQQPPLLPEQQDTTHPMMLDAYSSLVGNSSQQSQHQMQHPTPPGTSVLGGSSQHGQGANPAPSAQDLTNQLLQRLVHSLEGRLATQRPLERDSLATEQANWPKTLPNFSFHPKALREDYGITTMMPNYMEDTNIPLAGEIKAYSAWCTDPVNLSRSPEYSAPIQPITLAKTVDIINGFIGFMFKVCWCCFVTLSVWHCLF